MLVDGGLIRLEVLDELIDGQRGCLTFDQLLFRVFE